MVDYITGTESRTSRRKRNNAKQASKSQECRRVPLNFDQRVAGELKERLSWSSVLWSTSNIVWELKLYFYPSAGGLKKNKKKPPTIYYIFVALRSTTYPTSV